MVWRAGWTSLKRELVGERSQWMIQKSATRQRMENAEGRLRNRKKDVKCLRCVHRGCRRKGEDGAEAISEMMVKFSKAYTKVKV